jgi:hypothetical protein
MKKFQKLFLALVLVTLALSVVAPVAAACRPAKIAQDTQCVKDQIDPLRASGIYNETITVTDNGNGTYTVTFTYDPKCLNFNPPCGLASRIVTATVDCATETATCP